MIDFRSDFDSTGQRTAHLQTKRSILTKGFFRCLCEDQRALPTECISVEDGFEKVSDLCIHQICGL